MTTTQLPTQSQFIEAAGTRYAYRTMGQTEGTPLVLFVHFRGTIENWDPQLLTPLASSRPVILFDNKGVGETNGETPDSVSEMAQDAIAFIQALGHDQVDILGFSIGGMVAQEVAIQAPHLVRKMILAGTSPEAGVNPSPEIFERMNRHGGTEEDGINDFMFFFYGPTETSRAAGMASLERIFAQKQFNSSDQVKEAQMRSVAKWAQVKPDEDYDWLRTIEHPVLVTNGVDDVMVPTQNSYILTEKMPNAQLIIYPDSGHGHLFQFPELFAAHVNLFLDSDAI
ncbi:alpha/beta hydrolase [Exiguobacterium sp. K1]|uniref:alpha/beta fold hydrolase n=1 Tax=Exiguobacterium sp. K1 TaxID=2980105 RepID=UPI00299D4A0D|nr:alpha/beta hydrolase [Exiguobacterium sp. K1]MDX1259617.1 alpha/beta hydrolase [Exiguobacterium sp. K1]